MEKVKKEIKRIENKISSCDGWAKFFRGVIKVLTYMHIGFAGTFAVSAMKDLAIGSMAGLYMFAGLFASAFVTYGIGELIQSGFKSKKEKLQEDLYKLNLKKKELEKINSKKNNSSYVHLNYNGINYGLDKEMKLTLRK